MFCRALRYLSVVISIGTRAGRASYVGNKRDLIPRHFCPLLLILGKAPYGLGIKAIVQYSKDIVQTVDGA